MTVLDDGTVMCSVCAYTCPEDDARDGIPTHKSFKASLAPITAHGYEHGHVDPMQIADIWGIDLDIQPQATCRGVGADPWEWTAAHQADSQLPVHDDIGDTDDRLDSALAGMWRDAHTANQQGIPCICGSHSGHETNDYGDPRPYTYCHGRYNGETRERCTVRWPMPDEIRLQIPDWEWDAHYSLFDTDSDYDTESDDEDVTDSG